MIRIGSFGCGVNSVAGLCLNLDLDEWIFADTGSERPETYAYLDYIREKYPITVVKSKHGVIYDYYYEHNAQPSPMRRDCTDKFKKQPIRQYLREKYGTKELIEMNIFFAYDELDRMRESDVKWITNSFPLIPYHLTREDCINLIQENGLRVPIKSGCYFCPFTRKSGWIDLREKHPDLWQKSKALEDNSTMRIKFIKKSAQFPEKNLIECGCFNGL